MQIKPLRSDNSTKIVFSDDDEYENLLVTMSNSLKGRDRALDSAVNIIEEALQTGYNPDDQAEKKNLDDKNEPGKPSSTIPNTLFPQFAGITLSLLLSMQNDDASQEFQDQIARLQDENYELRRSNDNLNKRAADLESKMQDNSEANAIVMRLQSENGQLKERLTTAESASSQTEQTVAQLKQANADLQAKLDNASPDDSETVKNMQGEISRLHGLLTIGQNAQNQLTDENKKLQEQIDKLHENPDLAIPEEMESLKQENTELKQTVADMKANPVVDNSDELNQLKADYDKLKSDTDMSIASLKAENEKLKNNPVDTSLYINRKEYELLKGQKENLEKQNESLMAQINQSNGNSSNQTKQIQTLSNQVMTLQRDLRTAQDENERLRKDKLNGPSQSEIDQLKNENQIVKLRLAQVYQQLQSTKKKKGLFK